MKDEILHPIECACEKCKERARVESGNGIALQPQKCLCIHALDGYETYKVDDNTIDVRPFWYESKVKPPRKDIPILVVKEFSEMPDVVRWLEDGTYGESGFFESNDEYDIKEEDILYWMPLPQPPKEIYGK